MVNQMPNADLLKNDAVLAEMLRRLVERFHPVQLYLFGSRGRGEATADSDYDLMVVVANSTVPRYRREIDAFRVLRGVGAAKDVVVYTREELERKKSVVSSLPATVLREGKLLYAA